MVDPKPFIKRIELAAGKLIALRNDLQSKAKMFETTVDAAEREFSRQISNLNVGFEVARNSSTHHNII